MHYDEHSSALKLADRLVMVDPSGESRASWPLPQGALCTDKHVCLQRTKKKIPARQARIQVRSHSRKRRRWREGLDSHEGLDKAT